MINEMTKVPCNNGGIAYIVVYEQKHLKKLMSVLQNFGHTRVISDYNI